MPSIVSLSTAPGYLEVLLMAYVGLLAIERQGSYGSAGLNRRNSRLEDCWRLTGIRRTPTYKGQDSYPSSEECDMPPAGPRKTDLLKGTLDMLVLQTLSVQPLHGYGIAQQIEALSEDALRVEQGSLYPALERLQAKGWITSKWRQSPTGRNARYYTITAAGRRQLGNEILSFDEMLVAINRVLRRA